MRLDYVVDEPALGRDEWAREAVAKLLDLFFAQRVGISRGRNVGVDDVAAMGVRTL